MENIKLKQVVLFLWSSILQRIIHTNMELEHIIWSIRSEPLLHTATNSTESSHCSPLLSLGKQRFLKR